MIGAERDFKVCLGGGGGRGEYPDGHKKQSVEQNKNINVCSDNFQGFWKCFLVRDI